jgi:mRNA interferase MazF
VNRGDVYLTRFDPSEGSEQAGIRPAVIVSRDPMNAGLSTVVVVPFTSYRPGRRLYPSRTILPAGEGGLPQDSVAIGEQVRVVAKHRLLRLLGTLSPNAVAAIDEALRAALNLDE